VNLRKIGADYRTRSSLFSELMSIRQLLQAQLYQNPAAIAIKDAFRELTYQQLNSQVDRLANYLRHQGVKPEVTVGIYAERSIDTAIAILGVLKAGGAYVPIDPGYPQARLTAILEEIQPRLILTQQHLVKNITIAEVNLFLLDKQWDEIANESEDLEVALTTPEHLAYIMYTSGSTGKPQGVMVTISQVESYLQAVNQVANIQPGDIYLHTASFSFSSSIRQLLLPLSQGAQVRIASKENTTNLGSLLELIKTENITVFDTVASVWNYLLDGLAEMTGEQRSQLINNQLRLLVFSGGLLTSQLLNRVRSQFQEPPRILNIYGQTETIGVCAYVIPDDFSNQAGYAPVGIPYPYYQLHVLDDRLQPVSGNQTGELYVASTSLARGYLHNPQLNARKFIPNPFTTDDRSQLYRTGDLARYLPDGNLEIVGRQDFQVKIRGMRVEIEEIETLLTQHPDVRQAAVVGKEDKLGEQKIFAYIVASQKHINIGELRSFLQTKLPDYAVPSAFEILDALPLTPNHKLDRKRLPAPSREHVTIIPAADELEQQLLEIWEKVLDIRPIGVSDNFFELGGHSLIALQLFAQIEQRWNKRLLLANLIESPTIAQLAKLIHRAEEPTTRSPLVLIESGGDRSPLFCIHPVGGNLFDYYNLAKKLTKDLPIYGLQARGIDGKQQPFDRIEDMASYYVQAIQTIQPQGTYFLLGYSFGGIIAFEMARQLTDRGCKVAFLGLLDIRCPTIPQLNLPLVQGINRHLNKLKELKLIEQLKYCIDTIFYRKKIEYRDELITTLSNLDMFTPDLLTVLDCNLQAKKEYLPQVYSGQATLFWTEDQSHYIDLYPELGWGDLVTEGLEIQHLPGNHLTLMKEPYVPVLAEKLQFCIDNAVDNWV
jgi:amino acid adenylation domain-containing protein